MAGHDQCDRVGGVRPADGAEGAGTADLLGQGRIGRGLAERDLQERRPDLLLERRALGRHRHVEAAALAREIFGELAGDGSEGPVVTLAAIAGDPLVLLLAEAEVSEPPGAVDRGGEWPDGRLNDAPARMLAHDREDSAARATFLPGSGFRFQNQARFMRLSTRS